MRYQFTSCVSDQLNADAGNDSKEFYETPEESDPEDTTTTPVTPGLQATTTDATSALKATKTPASPQLKMTSPPATSGLKEKTIQEMKEELERRKREEAELAPRILEAEQQEAAKNEEVAKGAHTEAGEGDE